MIFIVILLRLYDCVCTALRLHVNSSATGVGSDNVYGRSATSVMSNMSAYYSSMLPPSSLPGSSAVTSQDSLYAHDGKYDAGASSFFNSAAANAAARYESCAPDNSFPRYPPFERFDAMSGTAPSL